MVDLPAITPPVSLSLSLVDGLQIVSIAARRGRADELKARLRSLLQIDAPQGPGRAWAGGVSLLGVGPDRWLAVREGVSPPLSALELELAGLAAVCDQGDAYAVFAVAGPAAGRVLAKGVPVDLNPSVFGLESAAATLVAHMGVILWRMDDGYRVAVFRSYVQSFRHWLDGAAAEFVSARAPDEVLHS